MHVVVHVLLLPRVRPLICVSLAHSENSVFTDEGGACVFLVFGAQRLARLALNFVRFVHNQTHLCTSARMAKEEEECSDEFHFRVVGG